MTDLGSRIVAVASRVAAALCLLAASLWLVDSLSLRFLIPARPAHGSFSVRTMYGVKKKNGSTEFFFDDPVQETCVNSLLPHQGHRPCWWVSRHTTRSVDLCDGCSVNPTRNQ